MFSDDGGDTWDVCPYDLEQLAGLVTYLGDMGPFHSCLGVHRTRPDTLAIGWLSGPAYSTDAGRTWKLPTGGIHADKHSIAFAQGGGDRVFVGCDGGVFSTDDLGDTYHSSWNRQLTTLQCYSSDGARQSWGGAGATPTIPGLIATGTQDNGNVYTTDSGGAMPYRPLSGGDGPNHPAGRPHGAITAADAGADRRPHLGSGAAIIHRRVRTEDHLCWSRADGR
jgi:hypothetical protein